MSKRKFWQDNRRAVERCFSFCYAFFNKDFGSWFCHWLESLESIGVVFKYKRFSNDRFFPCDFIFG